MTPCISCGSTEREEITLNKLPLFRCSSCCLMWRRTFDVPLSHYEETDPRSSPERSLARMRNARDRIRTMFRNTPKTMVCDVGTGEGTFLIALKEEGGSGVGIEPGKRYVAEARAQGVRIVGETFNDVPRVVREEGIETLTLFHVIEHIKQPDEMLALFYRALPAGGRIIIETPNMDSPLLKASGYKSPLIYPEHLYYFNETNLAQLLERIGFKVKEGGRRDFDQYHLPIRESFRRLFFSRASGGTVLLSYENSIGWRARLRSFLAHRVINTGRLPYMWYVAEK